MKVLYTTDSGIEVNKGDGMARGLYNLSRNGEVTPWFNEEELDALMELSDEQIEEEFNYMLR